MASKRIDNSIFSSIIITIIFICGTNETDLTDCKNVTCPSHLSLVCPLDSVERVNKFYTENNIKHPNSSNDGFYVEVPPDDDPEPEAAKNVRKRSVLQYKRESIIIVPGAHINKRSIPEDENTIMLDVLDKQNNSLIINQSMIDNNINKTDLIKQCCHNRECVCKPECTPPICEPHQFPIALKAGEGTPGHCCPAYRCDTLPNCRDLPNDFEWWQPCKTCRCIKEQSFCHDTCIDEHQPSCYSLSRKRPYLSGEKWMEDECTLCECVYGDMKCQSSVCRTLSCLNKSKPHGECCPVCDNNETHFCVGEESCDYVCPHGFQIQPPTNCTLCKCAVVTSHISIGNKTAYYDVNVNLNQNNYSSTERKETIKTPPNNDVSCQKETILIFILFLVTFGFLLYIAFSIYCWRKKRSYKMIPQTVVDINLNKITTTIKSNQI